MQAPRSAAFLSAIFYLSLTITSESTDTWRSPSDDPGMGDAVPESAVEVQNHGVDSASKWRVLFAGCLAHITHDGLTDMLYVFFPIWQQAFALSFFEVGLLKTAFSGTMSLLQIPAGILARRMGILKVLCLGTLLTGAAVTALGFAGFPLMIGVLLVLGGMGSSTQHPLASSAISNAYQGKASRVALSTYNFSGDIGKLIIPATAALLIAHVGWRPALHLLGGVGFLAAAVILIALPRIPLASVAGKAQAGRKRGGLFSGDSLPFAALSAIGVLDSATRMGFLTYLPFLLRDKGATVPIIGLALSLIFAGGALGKFVCGVAATRVGILGSVIITELATAALYFWHGGSVAEAGTALVPAAGDRAEWDLVGSLRNGSGTCAGRSPERGLRILLHLHDWRGRGFPAALRSHRRFRGIKGAVAVVAATVLAVIPLTLPLRGKLQNAE